MGWMWHNGIFDTLEGHFAREWSKLEAFALLLTVIAISAWGYRHYGFYGGVGGAVVGIVVGAIVALLLYFIIACLVVVIVVFISFLFYEKAKANPPKTQEQQQQEQRELDKIYEERRREFDRIHNTPSLTPSSSNRKLEPVNNHHNQGK